MLVKQVDIEKVELVQRLAHEFLAYKGMKVGAHATLSLLSHPSYTVLAVNLPAYKHAWQ